MSPDLPAGTMSQWIRRIVYGSAFVVVTLAHFVVCAVILLNWQMRSQINELHQFAAGQPADSIGTVIVDRRQPEVSVGEKVQLGGLFCLGLVLSGSLARRLATGRGLLPQGLVRNARLPYGLGMSFAALGHVVVGITLLAGAILLPDVQDNPNADPDVFAIPIFVALVAYAASVACIEMTIGVRALRSR